jgi:Molybdopterin biosynthesis enzyme
VIEFREAIKLMLNHVRIMNKIKLSLLNSLNYVLAEDIYATIDLPPFDNSAVDGYALKSQDIINANEKIQLH